MALRRRRRADARPLAGGTRSPHVDSSRKVRNDGPGSGWTNGASGQGSAMDRQKWTEFDRGCELSAESTNALMRHSAIARRMARKPSEDSTREGHVVKGSVQGQPLNVTVGGPPVQKDEPPDHFSAWVQRFGLHRLVIQADSQALAHGRALWVYGVDDGQMTDQPLDIGAIRELLWIRVSSRERATPVAWGTDPSQPRFEQPTHYQVTFLRSGITALYHWTRVDEWDGVDISDEERAHASDGAGGSVFDLAWSALRNYGVAQETAVEALTRMTQAVWTNDRLAHAVDGGAAGEAAQHYERVAYGGGQFGDYVLAAGESYSIVGRSPAGIGEVMERFEMALVAASPMSEPVLMGTQLSISGLNNDGDGLVRSWYDQLRSEQPERFTPHYQRFYTIASRALNGPTGGVPILDLEIGWPPLWQESPSEKAATRATNATSRATDIAASVVSVGEARTDQTLIDEYELAPVGVATVELEPEVAIEDIELADDGLMPPGESPIGLKAAAAILGRKSAGSARNFVAANGVPLFRPNGVHYAVYESHMRTAMRESQVV